MSALLIELSIGLAALNFAIAGLVVANRFVLRRHERRYEAASARLKPAVLDWIDGDGEPPHPSSGLEHRAMISLLAKYGRSLTGDGRRRITDLAEDTGLIATSVRRLGSRSSWRRAEAAYTLGDIGRSQTEQLIPLLSDGSRQVRNAAARSLGKQGSMESVAPIVIALSTGAVARAIGGQALIDIGSSAAPGLAALMESANPDVRAVAAELLGRVGTVEHGRALVAHLTDDAPQVRVATVRALGRLGGRAAAAAVPALLDDEKDYVRAAAATAVGVTGRRDHFDRLIRMASDDDYLPARAAATAAAGLDLQAVVALSAESGNPFLIEAAEMARGAP